MVTNVSMLKEQDYLAVDNLLLEKGYFKHEYVTPPRSVVTTANCPICKRLLNLYLSGNSHQITCESDDCFVSTFRGL